MAQKVQHPVLKVNPKTILPRVSAINSDRGLSPGEKVLLTQMTIRAGERGVIWHGNRALAEDIGLSVRQMTRHLAKLKARKRIIEETSGSFRYLCPWPNLEARLAEAIGKPQMTTAGSQKCPGEVVTSDRQSGPEKDANISECQVFEATQQDSKRKSENKRKKKTNTELLGVRDKLDRLDSSWFRTGNQCSFLNHLDDLTEKKIDIPARWEEYVNSGMHEQFVKTKGEATSREQFVVMLKQRYKSKVPGDGAFDFRS